MSLREAAAQFKQTNEMMHTPHLQQPQQISFLDLRPKLEEAGEGLSIYFETQHHLASARAQAKDSTRVQQYEAALADAGDDLRALGFEPPAEGDRKRKDALIKKRRALERVQRLGSPSVLGAVDTAAGLPAHVAPPSGGEAVAVFSLVEGTDFAGKIIQVSGGKVTKTDGKPPKETFFTAVSLGVSTLEDVQHYGRQMDQIDRGLWVRAHLKAEYAPAVAGVRRAVAPSPEWPAGLDFPGFEPAASRLQIFDLDKLKPPAGLDIGDFDAVVEFCLAYLPPACRDAPTLWTPTSSHGLNGTISMRAFCLTDRALTPDEFKRWAPEIEGADAAMGSSIQAVYVQRYCEDEATGQPCADPYAALRWRIRPGHYRYATVLDSDLRVCSQKPSRVARAAGERVARVRRGDAPKGSSTPPGRAAEDFLDAVDLIGAPENGGHIHGPLGSAIGFYFAAYEPTPENADTLYAILSDRLESLPARGPGEKQPEAYLAGLEGQIDAIRHKEAAARAAREEARAKAFAVVDDDDDEPTQSADEVGAEIRRQVAAFFANKDHRRALEVGGLDFAVIDDREDGDESELPEHPVAALKRQVDGGSILDIDRYAALVPWAGFVLPAVPDGAELFRPVGRDGVERSPPASPDGGALYLLPPAFRDGSAWSLLPDEGRYDPRQPPIRVVKYFAPTAGQIKAYQQAVALSALGLSHKMQQANGSMMLAVSVATGKTTHAAAVVNEYVTPGPKGEGGSRSVAWLSCDHDLLQETADKIRGMAIYMGPDAENAPDGWCVRKKSRALYVKTGGAQEDYCHTRCPWRLAPVADDPKFDGAGSPKAPEYRCGYMAFAQRAKGARVWGFADSLGAMTRPLPLVAKQAGMKKPTRIVADEPEMDKMIHIGAVILEDWDADLSRLDTVLDLKTRKAEMLRAEAKALVLAGAPEDDAKTLFSRARSLDDSVAACRALRDEFAAFMRRVERTFIVDQTDAGVKFTVERLRSIMPEGSLTPEQIRQFGVKPADSAVEQSRFDDLTERAPDADVLAMTHHNATVRQAASLLEALHQMQLEAAPASLVLDGWYFGVVKVGRWEGGKVIEVERRALHFKHKARFADDWRDVRLLMLDATAQDDLVRCVDPATHIVRLTARETAVRTVVRHVPCRTEDWPPRAPLVDAWLMRKVRAFGGDACAVGVIGHLAMIHALKKLHDGEPPYLTAHWGKETGFNRMEGVKLLATFGRPLRPADQTVSDATALMGRPGQQVSELVIEPSGWAARHGGVFPAGRLEVPGDGLHRALHANTLDGAVIQAIGRGRGVRRTAANPLQVEVFIDTAIPGVLVDEVLRFERFEDAVKADERDGLHGLVANMLAAGRVPVGGGAAKLWRALAGWTETGDAARKRWDRERERDYDGQTLGAVLDAAEAAARADAGGVVVRAEREGMKATVVLRGPPALDWLTELGFACEVLTGKARWWAVR